MSNKNKLIFFFAIILQIILLLFIIIQKETLLSSGTRIVVQAFPVDPRSICRGDYVNLNYSFSNIDLNNVSHDTATFCQGKKVYVKLLKTDTDWIAAMISNKPVRCSHPQEITIVGSVAGYPAEKSVHVIYGIESYFVQESKGKQIEQNISERKVTVEIVIDKKGYAAISKLFINGEDIEPK